MKLLNTLIGKAEPTPAKTGLTGHFKKPVEGPVFVGRLGLENDVICDLDHHGGVDQAVYLFGEPDRLWWQTERDHDTPPGFFGENLLISHLHSATLAIGDKLMIGKVVLEITSPRIPCATYAAHIGSGQAIKKFYAAERPGAYARVLTTGFINANDKVILRPYAGIRLTIVENMRAYIGQFNDTDFLRNALTVPAHQKLHALARERLGNA